MNYQDIEPKLKNSVAQAKLLCNPNIEYGRNSDFKIYLNSLLGKKLRRFYKITK